MINMGLRDDPFKEKSTITVILENEPVVKPETSEVKIWVIN